MIVQCLNCENEFTSKNGMAKFCSDICRATFNQNIRKGIINVKIYGLLNPETDSIFYVGKTVGSLQQRLNAHLKDNEGNIQKRKIISELKERGRIPVIVGFEEIICENEEQELNALLREKYWMDFYNSKGKLCNVNGAKNKFTPRMISQHSKTSSNPRTNTMSVRFKVDEFEFIKNREKHLKSAQDVVYFLSAEYCKLYRVEKKSVFDIEIPKEMREKGDNLGKDIEYAVITNQSFDSVKIDRTHFDEVGQWQEPLKDYSYYELLGKKVKFDNAEALIIEIMAAPLIKNWQKPILQKMINERFF